MKLISGVRQVIDKSLKIADFPTFCVPLELVLETEISLKVATAYFEPTCN